MLFYRTKMVFKMLMIEIYLLDGPQNMGKSVRGTRSKYD